HSLNVALPFSALLPVASVDTAATPALHMSGEVTVFAASSLTDAFNEIGERFKRAYPSARITFNLAASTQLFTQIDQGARADIFASADQAQMDRTRNANHIDGPDTTFATNR